MDDELMLGLLSIGWLAALIPLLTCGTVLLGRFWLFGASQWGRIIFAAIGGPLALFLPGMLIAFNGDEQPWEVVGIISSATLLLVVLLGIPTALVATRKLDRMLADDIGRRFE